MIWFLSFDGHRLCAEEIRRFFCYANILQTSPIHLLLASFPSWSFFQHLSHSANAYHAITMPNITQYQNPCIVFLRSYRSQTSFCQSSRRAGGPYLCCRCQMKRCTRRHGTAAEAIGRTMEIIRTFGPLLFSTFSRGFACFFRRGTYANRHVVLFFIHGFSCSEPWLFFQVAL